MFSLRVKTCIWWLNLDDACDITCSIDISETYNNISMISWRVSIREWFCSANPWLELIKLTLNVFSPADKKGSHKESSGSEKGEYGLKGYVEADGCTPTDVDCYLVNI